MTFAPKLLTRGEVDPTKVTVNNHTVLLAAVDTSNLATAVLTKVADLARRSNGEVIVLHVINISNQEEVKKLQQQSRRLLADIKYKFLTPSGVVAEEIVYTAQKYNVTAIVMGKRGNQPWEQVLLGSVSQAVLESSSIPVILLENSD
jgi:nucleotide-binding universal stress UspA family protein